MKILVVGGGGREHAMAWRASQDPGVERVYGVPGNAGMAADIGCVSGNILDPQEMASLAEYLGADCTVVGPEAPLVAGIVDEFNSRGLGIVGPTRVAAQLEGSKAFAKDFLLECGLPTAKSVLLDDVRGVDAAVGQFGYPVALKADGLAAGKGVIIVEDEAQARATAREMLAGNVVGDAGRRVLVEQFLAGEEVSFMVLSDGEAFCALPATQDHKRALEGDRGPNTGGMGAYCDDSIITGAMRDRIVDTIVEPALAGMRRRGTPFKGFLYCGLMLTEDGPQVLEFNVRLGDPETQPLLYRLEGGFAELLASAARGVLDPSLVRAGERPTACVVMASEGYPGSYPKGRPISGLSAAEQLGAKVFHAGTALAGGAPATSGGRVLGVTARGESLEAALSLTYQAVGAIRFEGAQYRRDIGRRGLERVAARS
ncbi:MAG: phosphoribosylamine--glycine ligase [Acidobacteriia bacterium]|nr:phosphoribosylamine--glycine ligase [Terriglobia bacterium]